jgi:SAM-dependent methyltransferase
MAGSYDELEPWYEHLYSVLHAILDRTLSPVAVPGGPARALDAGCGTGWQAARLAALGYRAHGVDVAAALLARARQAGVARLARASIEALPYGDAVFDAVACCGSTLSFVDEPARAVGELARVLRPGGRLLLECEHRGSLDLLWALASALAGDPLRYGLTPRQAIRQVAAWPGRGVVTEYPGYGRLRLFTLSELRAMLGGAGLAVERVWGIHVATNLLPSTWLHARHPPRPLTTLFRLLCRVDDGLRRLPLASAAANSVVVLARRRFAGTTPAR